MHEDTDPNLPKLEAALRGLEKDRLFVPEEKDREILDAAREHFRQRKNENAAEEEQIDVDAFVFRSTRRVKEPKLRTRPKFGSPWQRWMPLAASIAIAALMLYFARPETDTSAADTNRDGRIDVRDALLLAERMRSGKAPTASDVNGDGTLDAKDADEILAQAVALEGSGS